MLLKDLLWLAEDAANLCNFMSSLIDSVYIYKRNGYDKYKISVFILSVQILYLQDS